MEWNYHFMMRTIPEESMSQNMLNFSVSFCQENAEWLKIVVPLSPDSVSVVHHSPPKNWKIKEINGS
jgi:hypothetical protein